MYGVQRTDIPRLEKRRGLKKEKRKERKAGKEG